MLYVLCCASFLGFDLMCVAFCLFKLRLFLSLFFPFVTALHIDTMPTIGTLNEEGVNVDLYIPRKCHASNSLITATDFGFEPFSAAFGAVKNQNEMKLYIEVEGSAN